MAATATGARDDGLFHVSQPVLLALERELPVLGKFDQLLLAVYGS
jgi:hypothetical protein